MPIEEIRSLLQELWDKGELAPICLSTIGLDGNPNARFVDLKDVSEGCLHFGCDARSTKALEFSKNSAVSLCAWWNSLEVQVRVSEKKEIERPSTWWVYSVRPSKIEILRFSKDRIHLRTEYQKSNEEWNIRILSP